MKKYYTLILLSILFFNPLFSQEGQIKRADKLYEAFDFSSALDQYKKAEEKNADNIYVKSRIGNCYRLLSKIGEAENWYAQVAESDGAENIYKFYYAQSLMANAKYEEALTMFNTYYDSEGTPELKIGNFDNSIFNEDATYEVKIGNFNTKYSDFSPLRINDKLYFVSNRQTDVLKSRQDVWSGRPYTKIYTVDASDEENTKTPELFNKDLSKKYHEGSMSWDRIKNDLYITRSNYLNKKTFFGDNKEINLKIFKVSFNSGTNEFGDQQVDNVSYDDKNFSIAHPAITADGKYMIFASDMPGGFGGLDLYVGENVDGTWSNPLNLGANINTPGNEAFPFIMSDGTLYFSSDGHLGIGGYDIFYSELNDEGAFGLPNNVRKPINSQSDDFGFWMDDNYSEGYFTSNRPSIFGDDDIYIFSKEPFNFEAVIFDSQSDSRLDSVKVLLKNLDTNEEIILYTDAEGRVESPIEPFSNYNLKIMRDGFVTETADFSTIDDEVYAEIPLVKDFGITLELTVIDAETKKEIPDAEILLAELVTGREGVDKTNAYGKVLLMLDEEIEYRLKVSKKLTGNFVYLATSFDFNTFGVVSPAKLNNTVELRKVNRDEDIEVDNIYYDLGKYNIREDAEPELMKLVKILKDNPNMDIELSSHTDCRGSKVNNAKLSAKRAEAAVNFLIDNGINYRRLTATGYGESKINNGCTCEGSKRSNCSDLQHKTNRKTVFSILKFD